MDERELKEAFEENLVVSQVLSPMDSGAALDQAQRASRRRRGTIAGVVTAAAVVAITAGAVALSGGGAEQGGTVSAGAQGVGPVTLAGETPRLPRPLSGTVKPGEANNPNASPDTKTPWPTGPDGKPQSDRTARAGAQHEQGAALLEKLSGIVPAGYASTDQKPKDQDYSGPLRNHQAQFADKVDGRELWEYMAGLPVTKPGSAGVGRLLAQVHTAGGKLPSEPCALTKSLWGMAGDCKVITVAGNQVGVVTKPGERKDFDQWAGYRHADGTAVFIAQAKQYAHTGLPAIAELPLTLEQLALAVTDTRFRPQ